MQVREIMSSDVQLGNPDMTLRDAAILMRSGDFGLLPVGENDRLVGAISDRDITIRAVAEGRDPNTTAIREVMSDGIAYCFDDQSVEEVVDLMGREQIRRLPVVSRDKRLVGIVALADIATRCQDHEAAQAVAGVSRH